MCVCVCVCMCVCAYVRASVAVRVCMCVYIYVDVYTHTHARTHAHTHTHTHTHARTHTHTHTHQAETPAQRRSKTEIASNFHHIFEGARLRGGSKRMGEGVRGGGADPQLFLAVCREIGVPPEEMVAFVCQPRGFRV